MNEIITKDCFLTKGKLGEQPEPHEIGNTPNDALVVTFQKIILTESNSQSPFTNENSGMNVGHSTSKITFIDQKSFCFAENIFEKFATSIIINGCG
ncbi:MAG: hypothetical protein ACP5UZ_02320 [Thermoplasmata archaeon]